MSDLANICVGDLEVRLREHTVEVEGSEVPLSSREFEIVRMLAEHPGWVFSASQLSGDSDEGDYSPESVSVLVSRLRRKLAAAGAPYAIETVRGAGYRLHAARAALDETSDADAARRELRDAALLLLEAAIEVEHSGSIEEQRAAAELLEQARRGIFARLAG